MYTKYIWQCDDILTTVKLGTNKYLFVENSNKNINKATVMKITSWYPLGCRRSAYEEKDAEQLKDVEA